MWRQMIASRLLPLRDLDVPRYRQSQTLVDPMTGALIDTENGEGSCWLDYLRAVRDTYAQRRYEIARYLKERVNVPVVIKRVAPWLALQWPRTNCKRRFGSHWEAGALVMM